jgi:RNA ligase
MQFQKYTHLERWGATEVRGIEVGRTHIFPKLDGTNASVWLSEAGEIQAASRKRHLSLEDDNAGFYAWVLAQPNLLAYLQAHPQHRLFGEWLVPHAIRTYEDTAWRKFYIFDVAIDKPENEILNESDSAVEYLPYETYLPLLTEYNLDFIPVMAILDNPKECDLVALLEQNTYLIQAEKGEGEGIVIKNYAFKNKFRRSAAAKIVSSEFKGRPKRTPRVIDPESVEIHIAERFVTLALCEKVFAKIENETGEWSSKYTIRLLSTVYYDVIREDIWDILKVFKNPTINFKLLQSQVFEQVKLKMPLLF